MKYDVGQYVMYRNNGVCRIEAIGKLGFLQNSDEEYYTLRPPFTTSDEHSYVPNISGPSSPGRRHILTWTV